MRHRPARIRLERDVEPDPFVAKLVQHRGKVAVLVSRKTIEGAMIAFEHRARTLEAGQREAHRALATLGRPPRMHPLGPCAFGQVLDDSAREAARDSESIDLLRRG